jgi:hypothetical protein
MEQQECLKTMGNEGRIEEKVNSIRTGYRHTSRQIRGW